MCYKTKLLLKHTVPISLVPVVVESTLLASHVIVLIGFYFCVLLSLRFIDNFGASGASGLDFMSFSIWKLLNNLHKFTY